MTYRYAILPDGRWFTYVDDESGDDGDGIDGSDIVAGHLGEYGLDELTEDA